MNPLQPFILGIESSCDDTSAAVVESTVVRSNVTAGQEVHREFGGVVPELASRAHQQNIIPVIEAAIRRANIRKNQLAAVAFTRGPGLLGSLLVGTSFAKSFALGLGIPLIEVDHMHAHILAHFLEEKEIPHAHPSFPFICLTVSGGHTQIVLVRDHFDMEIIGQTIDDAAGETFDKAAKILGLSYPGGPVIDSLAQEGDPARFTFAKPVIPGLDYSFSGLKTSFLYFIRDELKKDPGFIEKNMADLCASIQKTIVDILVEKLRYAIRDTRYEIQNPASSIQDPGSSIADVAIAGGVSANSGLRQTLLEMGEKEGWNIFIPPFEYTTDNAAMVAIAGYFKYIRREFAGQSVVPYARMKGRRTRDEG
ncbi:MAG: tRNA (adenosine(37)-N6)-threonylcarbamoyltransferase complex transferase subunit TsaD [Bacteroidetes bacterium]|nr:MAG: tRNA (adenosine(37)-N6)-threonylcarbamoyltransferase complex transferase subunit TsaD [Bacteroidota bacterium]